MATKTTKKTVAKPATAKKTVVKSAPAKKPVAKKAPVKKTVAKVAPAPVVEKFPCGCDHNCACGGNCGNHGHCGKKKCTFGRFLKKLVIFAIIFALGFTCAKMCPFGRGGKHFPRPQFENGCMVVKECPKMAEMAAKMDADHDGCVSVEEFKAAKKHMRKSGRAGKRGPRPPMPTPAAEMPAPAPQVAE